MTLEEAGRRLGEASEVLEIEERAIEESLGYVLAEDLRAEMSQPPFRRSAMDGYAVRYSDIAGVTETEKVVLPVATCIYAGDMPLQGELHHTAVRIMTGAAVPDWADVVIPQELTDEGEQEVRIDRALKRGMNCVPVGEDFLLGDVLAEKGIRVSPYVIASGVAAGVAKLHVRRKIRVAVLSTGAELRGIGESLVDGQIYNSNEAYFVSRLSELDCEVLMKRQLGDDATAIQACISEIAGQVDLIVTTGGVSVGKKDYLPKVLSDLSADLLCEQIQIKPGSPTKIAKYKDTLILGLSGNPYSAIAMFESLFPYFEEKALGLKTHPMKSTKTRLKNAFSKKSPVRRLIRGVLDFDGVFVPEKQRNGQLQAGIGCNCLVDIEAGSPALNAGDEVTVHYREL